MGNSKTPELIRLNKFIADSGLCSRRKADRLIEDGEVKLNGKATYELGVKVNPQVDQVVVSGRPIRQEKDKVYYMFNKPRNVLTSMGDPSGRPTIEDFLPRSKKRLYPVGRLDWDTEGLLLITNDGEFAQEVIHPKSGIPKYYLAKISGHLTQEQIKKLLNGVTIVGGKAKAVSVEKLRKGADKYDWVKIAITEGRNRQVRKMFEKIGFDVMKLQRVAIGQLKLGRLKRGEMQKLTATDLLKIFEKPQGQNPRNSAAKRKPKDSTKKSQRSRNPRRR